jgi:predicted enzyme related to lactoylglutathione lyase
MCDDLQTTIKELEGKGVKLAEPVKDAGWGLLTAIEVPGGEILRLYQPKHPTALGLAP